MVWNSNCPDGSKSVKANVTIQGQNTTYTEDTLGNSTNTSKDHFWNIGVNEDGHHRAVQMIDYADTYVGAPASPALAADMDLAIFARTIGSSIEPMARNGVSIMQLLGIKAYAVFNNVAGNVAQTLVSSYNVTSVARQATGRFIVTYATALDSSNYLVLGGGMSSAGIDNICTFSCTGIDLTQKNTTNVLFNLYSGLTANNNIRQGWFVVFGGYT